MTLVLSILHNIFLTNDEIQRINKGESIDTIGASLPVWFYKGNTSEPAEEVFCKYKITNEKEHKPIKVEKDGYIINLPQKPGNYEPLVLSNDNYRKMTVDELNAWYKANPKPITAADLLPISEGGGEFIRFKEYNKIKRKNKMTTLIHIVEIKTVQNLLDSFT